MNDPMASPQEDCVSEVNAGQRGLFDPRAAGREQKGSAGQEVRHQLVDFSHWETSTPVPESTTFGVSFIHCANGSVAVGQ
jgi:hypothetical protein